MNRLSIVLEHETAFQFQDIIYLFLEQLAFRAYRSEHFQIHPEIGLKPI